MQVVETNKAPAAIGTYNQAIKVGSTVYLSGQIPLVPDTMVVISDEFEKQANQVFANLSAVCEAAGGSLANLVKINVYLTDLGQFQLLNQVMERWIKQPFPARAAVQVAALPKQVQIEIDGIMELS
ncbi:Rid family detoxifying hydrolase [Legionella sp. W05-934-2]|uniref:Rid family detoxifying hydrolase n=1 Tax=Legionella sp. W05-934-2 TaxID=1198649 RepID=UPI003461D5B3